MVQYSVILKRYDGSARPDVVIFQDEDRDKALKEMRKYRQRNGYSVQDKDGWFTIADIVLVEKEPIAGAPVISETPYRELFNN